MPTGVGASSARLMLAGRGNRGDGDALDALLNIAPQLVPGCDLVSLTQWKDGRPSSLVTPSTAVADVDRIEYDLAEGPTLSDTGPTTFVKVHDFAFDKRWPVFGEAVSVQTPVRSALSYRLSTRTRQATLTLYACVPGGFTVSASAPAAMVAVHVRSLLTRY